MMKNRSLSIQKHFKGHENLLSRLDDYIHQAHSYRKVFTPFLTPVEQSIVKSYIGHHHEVYLFFDGGYLGAENKRAFIYAMEEMIEMPITCLRATFHTKYHRITHRDVLGSIMNLGIQRSQVGDLVVEDGKISIFVCKEIHQYIMQELKKIGNCHVEFNVYDEEVQVVEALTYTSHVIRSFRLDVVVGVIAKISREKAKKMILSQNVKVNHIPLEDCAYICNNECIISVRGYGRFKLIDLNRTTKSHRSCIEIGKYE